MFKKIMTVTFSIILSLTLVFSASAYTWYADGDSPESTSVRIWSTTPTVQLKKIWTTTDTGFIRTEVESWLNSASSDWKKQIPVTFASGSSDTAQIEVFAGKPATLEENYQISFVGSNGICLNGLTKSWVKSSPSYDVTVSGKTRTVKVASRNEIYIINKLNSSGTYGGTTYPARTLNGQKNTTKHELGHALGWAGHSSNTSNVMRVSTTNDAIQNCTSADFGQLTQFRNDFLSRSALEATLNNELSDITETTEELTIENRIDTIKNATKFVQNVIVGTPIEMVAGTTEVLPIAEEGCEIMLTDYKFSVRNYAFGESGEDTITVRSQVGDVFEIGKEYTFAAVHINSVYYDGYNVNFNSWILSNDEVADNQLDSLLKTVNSKRATKKSANSKFVEEAVPTQSFISNADVVMTATVTEAEQDDMVPYLYDAKLDVKNIAKGAVEDYAISEFIRLRGDIEVGETYLIFFTQDEDGNLMLAARDGAVVPVSDAQYSEYSEILKLN